MFYVMDEISLDFQRNERGEPIWYESKEQAIECARDYADAWRVIEIKRDE